MLMLRTNQISSFPTVQRFNHRERKRFQGLCDMEKVIYAKHEWFIKNQVLHFYPWQPFPVIRQVSYILMISAKVVSPPCSHGKDTTPYHNKNRCRQKKFLPPLLQCFHCYSQEGVKYTENILKFWFWKKTKANLINFHFIFNNNSLKVNLQKVFCLRKGFHQYIYKW